MTSPVGQSSGDFLESQRRIHPLYMGMRATGQPYAPDAFTQMNPVNVAAHVSERLANVTVRGVLGGSVAFTRPDAGNGCVGGPPAAFNARARVLGLFIADASGAPYENLPGIASGQASYYTDGGTYAVSLYETFDLLTGAALEYVTGDEVWSSKNGFITNVQDEDNIYDIKTPVGIVKVAPSPDNAFMIVCLRL